MLSVCLFMPRVGINRTRKAFTASNFSPSRRNQANWAWNLGGRYKWNQRSPAVLLGEGHMGNVRL